MTMISIHRMICGQSMTSRRFVKRIARGASSIGGRLFDWSLMLPLLSRMLMRSTWHCENYWLFVITSPNKGHEQV